MATASQTSHAEAEILKDIIYAANDGIITTFAVAAGVWGGGLSALTVLILGFANLFADGFSMAISNYLGTESEKEFLEAEREDTSEAESPLRNSVITFFAFTLAGAIPILPFLPGLSGERNFFYSVVFSLTTLFIIGACRTRFTRKNWFFSGLEMFALGGVAAFIAYAVGFLIKEAVSPVVF